MPTMAEMFMEEARLSVERDSKTFTHKVTTMAWYTARKGIRSAPKKALSAVGGIIPVPGVGAAVNKVIEIALTKVDAARKQKKKVKYQQQASQSHLESLRKAAKSHAKDMKTLGDKIDGNLVKLKDAATAVTTAINAFNVEVLKDAPTKQKAWDLACALYTQAHYEDKLAVLVESVQGVLDDVTTYIDKSREQRHALEADLLATLELFPATVEATLSSPRGDGFQRLE